MTSPTTPDAYGRAIIAQRHGGRSWDEIAATTGLSVQAVKTRARRLKKAGAWKLPDGTPAGGATRDRPGRPRQAMPTILVSPRFAPAVEAELQEVAARAKLRLGEVVAIAMQRLAVWLEGRAVPTTPLGLDPHDPPRTIRLASRTKTVSVRVPQRTYEHLVSLDSTRAPLTFVAEAVHELLRDLGCELVDRSV